MTKKQQRTTTIKDIYEYSNHLLHVKLVSLIIGTNAPTLQELREIIADRTGGELSPSQSTVNNYRLKVLESNKENISFEELIDKRKKNGKIVDIADKRNNDIVPVVGAQINQVRDSTDVANGGGSGFVGSNKLVSTLQVLEKMITIGANTLDQIETLDPSITLKAMESYNKVTGGAGGGITLSGIQQIAMIMKAKEAAQVDIISRYVPAEQQEEVMHELEVQEEKFYQDLDLTAEGQEAKRVLKALNISL